MTAAARHTEGHTEGRQRASRRTHRRQEASGGQAEGRKGGGERGADGLAPGEWWRRGTKRRHGSREGTERADKKEYVIYLRERGEKNTAETRKSVQVCAYTFYLISWHSGRILHFLLYILEGYYIYIYIYIIPINVFFSFKVNVLIIYTLLYG